MCSKMSLEIENDFFFSQLLIAKCFEIARFNQQVEKQNFCRNIRNFLARHTKIFTHYLRMQFLL